MTNIQHKNYKCQAEFIYSKYFTNRFLGWCYSTHQAVSESFNRKYKNDSARHEDVTEFIINKLPTLLIEEPELFAEAVWLDETILYSSLRARLFTIYKNYCINRWNRYKTIKKYESQPEELPMNTIAPNIDIVQALVYRQVWLDYTNELDATDKIIAIYLLDGALTMKQLEAASGLKKSALYIRIDKIKTDLANLVNEKMEIV